MVRSISSTLAAVLAFGLVSGVAGCDEKKDVAGGGPTELSADAKKKQQDAIRETNMKQQEEMRKKGGK